MHRLLLALVSLIVIGTPAMAQTKITWKTLEDVRFTEKYSNEVEAYYYYPHFGPSVKALEGKELYLKGYMLALDPEAGFYLLSRYPMASCFFCGSGGPETIVQLNLQPGHRKFKMDQVVTMKGTLKLNKQDIHQCNYIFEDAVLFKPN
ncbi:MAG: DUF3299 domain-containing protein [Bacteroidota bacterium]